MSKQGLVLVLGGVAAGAALVFGYAELSSRTAEPPAMVSAVQATEPAAAETRAVPATRTELQLSFAPVVKSVTPSVVNVYATTISQRATSPFLDDPFFQRFFGGDGPFMDSRPQKSQSLGSGVIVDGAGEIGRASCRERVL